MGRHPHVKDVGMCQHVGCVWHAMGFHDFSFGISGVLDSFRVLKAKKSHRI